MSINYWKFVAVILAVALAGATARADGSGNPAVASSDNGKYADIYVYLRARANGAIPGGRPPKHEDKPEAAKAAEASCTGVK